MSTHTQIQDATMTSLEQDNSFSPRHDDCPIQIQQLDKWTLRAEQLGVQTIIIEFSPGSYFIFGVGWQHTKTKQMYT